MSGLTCEFPFMARLGIRSGEWLAIKGNGMSAQKYQVGAHFEALNKGVLLVPLDPHTSLELQSREKKVQRDLMVPPNSLGQMLNFDTSS